jgi:hypothetical protein
MALEPSRASATTVRPPTFCGPDQNMGLLLFSATRSTPWVIARRRLATVAEKRKVPQTVIEKIVQKYAVGLPAGKQVKAGDYVMIRPEHIMTHDNTGPVISKFVISPARHSTSRFVQIAMSDGVFFLGSSLSARRR